MAKDSFQRTGEAETKKRENHFLCLSLKLGNHAEAGNPNQWVAPFMPTFFMPLPAFHHQRVRLTEKASQDRLYLATLRFHFNQGASKFACPSSSPNASSSPSEIVAANIAATNRDHSGFTKIPLSCKIDRRALSLVSIPSLNNVRSSSKDPIYTIVAGMLFEFATLLPNDVLDTKSISSFSVQCDSTVSLSFEKP